VSKAKIEFFPRSVLYKQFSSLQYIMNSSNNGTGGRTSVVSSLSRKHVDTTRYQSGKTSRKGHQPTTTGSQQSQQPLLSNRTHTVQSAAKSIISAFAFQKRSKKGNKESKSLGVSAIDPVTKQDLTPLPLREISSRPAPLQRKNSVDRSIGSYTASGQVSPTSLSEVSEMERFSYASWGHTGSHTGSSSPSSTSRSMVSESEDIFLLNRGIPLTESMTSGTESESESVIDSKMSQDIYLSGAEKYEKKDEEEQQDEGPTISQEEIDEWMNQDFVIDLRETSTFFIFEHYDEAVPGQAEYLEEVRESNRKYDEAVKRKQTHKELFTNKEVQTLNKFYKNKISATQKTDTETAEVSVSGWEIFDEYKKLREKEEKEKEEKELISISHTTKTGEEEEEEDNEQDLNEYDDGPDDNASVRSLTSTKNLLANPKVRDALTVMERAIAQNLFHEEQIKYKYFEEDAEDGDENMRKVQETPDPEVENSDPESEGEESGEDDEDEEQEEEETKTITEKTFKKEQGKLESLWKFECNLSEGHNVNCMAWNRENSNILAVGYGNVDFVGEKEGLILCWTLKNPTFPERVIRVPHAGISSIDFSKTNPSLLSVGYNYGGVAIFDIRQSSSAPVLEASKNHTGTVWDLQWVYKGRDVGEKLHSVGIDGRVNSWSIKKGLECHEIMRLKRSSGKGSDQEAAVIARESGGLCIDFDRNDPKLYLVGTEDGVIKKCSTSYNEQSLETYVGHTGPVYRVRWNPFNHNTFLSCSADWTVRLWHQEKYKPLLTIESFSETMEKRSSSVTDVAWCNHISTMFASVSITGTVDVWDLAFSTLKPKYTKISYGRQLSSVLFAVESPIVLVGDDFGSVEVMKPKGLTEADYSKDISTVQFV
jgi:WD40 repeat protein